MIGLLLLAFAAQQPRQPSTSVITVSVGLGMRNELWSIQGQPLPASNTQGLDTLRLARALVGGFGGALGFTRYLSPGFGIGAEAGSFSLKSEQRCSGPPVYRPDPEQVNQQACGSANGRGRRGSVLALQAGPVVRLNAGGTVEPFGRLSLGVGMLSGSTVETIGFATTSTCGGCPLVIVEEDSPPTGTWLVTLAGGVTLDISPGSRLRVEVRDLVLPLLTADGPGPVTTRGQILPTSRTLTHRMTLMFGFDLVLDRHHIRRY